MKHRTSELLPPLLDAAVALAEAGVSTFASQSTYWRERDGSVWTRELGDHGFSHLRFSPSTSWDNGGPIIERENISVGRVVSRRDGDSEAWHAFIDTTVQPLSAPASLTRPPEGFGPTPLIAAMRAYVASKFGEEVELP